MSISAVAVRPQVRPSAPLWADRSRRDAHFRYLHDDCHWKCREIADLFGLSERQIERIVRARPAPRAGVTPLTERELSSVTARELASMATDYALDPYMSVEDKEESLAFVDRMLERMSGRPRVDGPMSA